MSLYLLGHIEKCSGEIRLHKVSLRQREKEQREFANPYSEDYKEKKMAVFQSVTPLKDTLLTQVLTLWNY